jgi:DNA-binding CsgD family transcriptional regulator
MFELGTDAFAQWNRHLAGIVGSSDAGQFPDKLVSAICTLAGSDLHTVVVFGAERKPVNLCEWGVQIAPVEHVQQYLGGAYLLDPVYRAGIECVAPGLYRIADLAPPGFLTSEYYRTHYEALNYDDEIGFITYLPDGCFANLVLIRSRGSGKFSNDEFDRLQAALPVVESLLIRYWDFAASTAEQGSEIYLQLEHALGVFGSSILTPREAEVMRMYLYGHDTRSISEKLNISTHTVSAHRKNAYARLDINSQAELFSLFINSMYCFDGDLSRDPLDSYLNDIAS